MPRGRGVGVAKSLEIGHPSKNWNARFGQELLVLNEIGEYEITYGNVGCVIQEHVQIILRISYVDSNCKQYITM